MKPGWQWPAMVVGLLSLNVGVCATTVYCSQRGASAARVVPQYFEKAENYDRTKATANRLKELGWMVDALAATTDQGRILRVKVCDRNWTPVDAASIECEIFHHAASRRSSTVTLTRISPGLFEGRAPLDRPGLWRAELKVDAPGLTFEASRDFNVAG